MKIETSTMHMEDIIDVRDIIERVEELEAMLGNEEGTDEGWQGTDAEWDELAALQVLLSELKGYGGDEQWRGDWYPVTLIRESYFSDYCQDLVIDCGGLPASIPDYLVIDWESTSRNLKVDYSEVDINGVTYLYR